MTMKFISLFNLLVVSAAYNIDTNYPILYPDSATNVDRYKHTNFQRNYFGYSVLLHRDLQKNISWLLVGAPRGNYTGSISKELDEPGVVYRCSLPGSCEEIEPAVLKDEKIFFNKVNILIYKRHSWFGAAMSIERNSGLFTICAPRTNKQWSSYWTYNIMEGVCYSDRISSMTVKMETSHIRHSSKYWWIPTMYGFSVSFESPRDAEAKNINRIIGGPSDSGGDINVANFATSNFYEIYSKDIHLSSIVPLTQNSKFGYTVTSGYYFDLTQSLFACADPGWNQTGQVAIMKTNEKSTSMVARLYGSEIGEFFGASLTTGDLNNDGLHDLVIGAPHWGNDNGRVYIYLGSLKKEFEAAVILEGAREDGEFGYAVANGDLDGDGFSDIIVSAPWEDSGVIYIYNGDAGLKDKVRPVVSQRIAIQDVRAFGFSISEPVDIDNNGYADIAVGAYKSGHVMILRSKPVVRTNLIVSTIPSILQKNVSSFFFEACVHYDDYDMAYTQPFKISLTTDKKYQRTKKTSLELFSTDPPIHTCVNISISLVDNIQDFLEPIVIFASHNFSHNNSSVQKIFCETCPVESRGSKSRSTQISLPFDIECGEDRICHSNISATAKFWGVGKNDSWMIGSNDITLEIHLQNYAEPAYRTKIMFTFPNGIVLRSILPSCKEDMDGDVLMITCTTGNFETDEQKVLKLDLDMRQLTNGSLHGHVLEFLVEIQTQSINLGINMTKALLTLQSEASLLLNGNAIEEDYYIPILLHEDQLNITFRHIYQILKLGATPLEEAQLVVNVPSAMNDLGSLVFLYKPQIFVSGKNYDCLSNGIDLIDIQQDEFQENTTSNANNLDNNETLNHTQNVMHNIFKRDRSRHTSTSYTMLQKLSVENMSNSTILNNNLTARESDIIYVNCSVYGINCSTIHCNLSALKAQKDIGRLVMQLILNVEKFKGIFGLSERTKILQFSTDAYVEIIQPANRIPDLDTRHNVNLTTKFHSIPKRRKLQLWIVLASISLGLILLCIVIIMLRKMGFFKRKTKEELLALKKNQITTDVNEENIVDTVE